MLLEIMTVERQMVIATPSQQGTRNVRRYPARVIVRVCLFEGQRSVVFQAMSNDLCTRGMSLYVPLQLEIGRRIQIELCLPISREHIVLNALVRDTEGSRCGVEFHELTPSQETSLIECCKRLSGALPDTSRRRRWERRASLRVRAAAKASSRR
jgi:hypothetical protein